MPPRVYDQGHGKPLNLGSQPTTVNCPHCGAKILTKTRKESGNGTICMALLLCCFCALIGGLLPFCIDDCQDTVHSCPNCGNEAGRNKFFCD
mmetsp:Transcript_39136/g.34820  ORF Transcript_39136/g.34820 Transcript_39136/m.34820 type:complete len:92 (+) Transcript_39136:394-669(+)